MSVKRIFLIVLDSFGVGAMPDAKEYGDEGSNTLEAVSVSERLLIPTMQKLGLYNIDGVRCGDKITFPLGSYGRMAELSPAKDTVIGHWELAGVVAKKAQPVYPKGFPSELIKEFEELTGHKVLCNRPYSGTQVLEDFGLQQMRENALIVYTSADSVFQIAAHEDSIGLDELYRCCEIARKLLVGEHAVGRVIARPFVGYAPHFTRTSNRRDYALPPPSPTMLNVLMDRDFKTIGIGKIHDIFAGEGLTEFIKTRNNVDGLETLLSIQNRNFNGLCFINLVDFDMLYGHRNDVDGYAAALSSFDRELATFVDRMREDDLLIITADHGCDPSFEGTDHTREYVPVLLYGSEVRRGVNVGTRSSFADIAATILESLKIRSDGIAGESFWNDIREIVL